MEKKYKNFLQENNLRAAKEEVSRMMASENKRDVLREVASSQSSELVFHAFSSLKDNLAKSDVPYLLEVLENMRDPMVGGEEVAAYIRTKNAIAGKIEELTGIQRTEEEKSDPDRLNRFISKVREWRGES